MECTKSALEEAASTLKKGVQSISNYFGIPGIPEGANIDLKFACQKLDISGKKLRDIVKCQKKDILYVA